MGVIISRFRKKKPTRTVLEEIEDKIKTHEQIDHRLERHRRAIVSSLIFFIVGVYVISAVVFWRLYSPFRVVDVLLYGLALITFTFLMLFLRKGLSRFYKWRIDKNQKSLTDTRAEKKRVLEEVMENETYKVAKELLAKFGHPQDRPTEINSPIRTLAKGPISLPSTPSHLKGQNNQLSRLPAQSTPLKRATSNSLSAMPLQVHPMQSTPLHGDLLPRPLLSGSGTGGALDKLVDFIVGDGPSRRYALICSNCQGHNGMALPEEFEYVSYWCAYCRHLNPAKKQKLKPPLLETTPSPLHNRTAISHRSSESSDSDDAPEGDFHFRLDPKCDDKPESETTNPSHDKLNEDKTEDESSNGLEKSAPESDTAPSAPTVEEVEAPAKNPEAKKED